MMVSEQRLEVERQRVEAMKEREAYVLEVEQRSRKLTCYWSAYHNGYRFRITVGGRFLRGDTFATREQAEQSGRAALEQLTLEVMAA
jgi:hypothetical protein